MVMWQKATSEASTILTVTITDASTSYTLRGLNSDTLYSITVMATNAAGSTTSVPILVSTSDEGVATFCCKDSCDIKFCEDFARTCLSVICTIYNTYTLLCSLQCPLKEETTLQLYTVGGVLGTALILSLTVIVIVVVVVIVLLKNRGDSSSRMQRKYEQFVHVNCRTHCLH